MSNVSKHMPFGINKALYIGERRFFFITFSLVAKTKLVVNEIKEFALHYHKTLLTAPKPVKKKD